MQSIINGKRYNTKTARQIADFWNGCGCGDFNRIEEALYKTKKGAYFLVGEGGPLSKYAENVASGGTSGGTDIILLSKKAAAEWCEQTRNYEALEMEFFDMVEDA